MSDNTENNLITYVSLAAVSQGRKNDHAIEVPITPQNTLHTTEERTDGDYDTLRSMTAETEIVYDPEPKPDTEEEEKMNNEMKVDYKDEEEIKLDISSKILYTILDADQTIADKAMDKLNPDNPLNSVDPNWKYNLTLGDIQKRRITLHDGTVEELWFPMEKSIRKVFVAFKVKRVSEVDNVAETFRMRFHMYFNWLPTEDDYRSYYKAKQDAKIKNQPNLLTNWEPKWYPHLEFQNMIEEQDRHWEIYPEEGQFRMQKFKDFAKEKGDIIPEHLFDCESARFLRAKLECEMTFAEELELQSFPFDCQDLSCVIHERTTGGVRCIFLPELRKPCFASIDPRYSVIDEWDLETAILEFGDADSRASRSKTSYAMIVLRLKVKRRWIVYMWNIVFLMFCIMGLALTAFALHYEDLGDRLNLLITLALTAVVFSYVVFDALPNVPYLTWMDKYILGSYAYIVIIMFESAFLEVIPDEIDYYVFFFFVFALFAYQGAFMWYAYSLRMEENLKLFFSSDQVEAEVNASRPSLRFDYSKRLRSGENGRLLSFLGYMQTSEFMGQKQIAEIAKSQERLEEMFQKQTTMKLREAANAKKMSSQSLSSF